MTCGAVQPERNEQNGEDGPGTTEPVVESAHRARPLPVEVLEVVRDLRAEEAGAAWCVATETGGDRVAHDRRLAVLLALQCRRQVLASGRAEREHARDGGAERWTARVRLIDDRIEDRKSTRLNSSHVKISYA